MLNVYNSGIATTINIVLSFGTFIQIWFHETNQGNIFIAYGEYSEINYFPVSPILAFIGIVIIIFAGFLFYRDRRKYQKLYAWLTTIGSFCGVIGTLLFLPLSFEVRIYNWIWYIMYSIGANWYYLGAIVMPSFFLGIGIWGIVQIVQFYKRPRELIDSELRLDSLASARRNLIEIQKTYDNLPVHMLRRLLDVNTDAELEELCKLLPEELQYSIVGKNAVFLKETVSKVVDPSTIIIATRKDYCFYCKAELSLNDKICPNCQKEVLHCALCKLAIKPDEEVGKCPKCEYLFHFKHLKTWAELKMKCPTCLQELLPSEVQTFNPLIEQSSSQ